MFSIPKCTAGEENAENLLARNCRVEVEDMAGKIIKKSANHILGFQHTDIFTRPLCVLGL